MFKGLWAKGSAAGFWLWLAGKVHFGFSVLAVFFAGKGEERWFFGVIFAFKRQKICDSPYLEVNFGVMSTFLK